MLLGVFLQSGTNQKLVDHSCWRLQKFQYCWEIPHLMWSALWSLGFFYPPPRKPWVERLWIGLARQKPLVTHAKVRRRCATRGQHTHNIWVFSFENFFLDFWIFVKYRFGWESWVTLVILVFYAELLFSWFQWSGQLSVFHLHVMSFVIHLEIEIKPEDSSAVWIQATVTLNPSL